MKIVLIGSGNVATHLALAIRKADIIIHQIWSKHYENAKLLAEKVDSTPISDLDEVDADADLCILAIKDDAIPTVASQMRGFNGTILHTSGAVDLTVFAKSFESYGVLYPLQTFSKEKHVELTKVPICIEAIDKRSFQLIAHLAKKLSDQVVEVSSEKRKVLHLAAVFACNFTNHLYTLSSELLAAHDLPFDLLRPLILETAEKVQQALPKDVQTGPAARGDEQTIKKHKELLLKHPELLSIYRLLSDSIKKTKK